MHIVVLVKRVPDTASKIKIDGGGTSVDLNGLQFVLNPYDEYAVEEALAIKERAGGGNVSVLTLGPAKAVETLRSALAMGADEGHHIADDTVLRDSLSTAKVLAEAIKSLDPPVDLILCGRQAVDDQSIAVGPMVATLLGYPCVTDIVKLEQKDGSFVVERDVEGGQEVVEVTLPALLSTQKGLNEPRYASIKGVMKAKRKKVANPAVTLAPPAIEIRKVEYPPARAGGRIVGEGAEAVGELVRLLREEAKVL